MLEPCIERIKIMKSGHEINLVDHDLKKPSCEGNQRRTTSHATTIGLLCFAMYPPALSSLCIGFARQRPLRHGTFFRSHAWGEEVGSS